MSTAVSQNTRPLATRGAKRSTTTTTTANTTTTATTATMKSANMKIFNENLVPSVKPSVVNTRQTTKRTALGEITNKIVDESKMKLKKKIEVKTETANATMVNMNQQANAAAAARRVPIQQPQKTSTVVTTKPLVKETHVLPVPNPEPIDDVVEDDLEEGEDDIEVFEDIPSESGEPMDIEEHAAFRDIAQPHPVQTRIMDEIWDSEEDVDSEEVEDIDQYDTEDPQFCTEYVHHIFKYFREKEIADAVNHKYMERQVDITDKHRMILIDWLAEVAVKFKLLTETMFLSVNIIDRFLQYKAVARQKLQLVGVTAMLIASKYEEIYTPEVNDFIWISAKAYTREEMLKMERLILLTLDFNLNIPTPLHFLRRFSKAARSDSKIHTLSKYLTELSLLEYKMLKYPPSIIAAAAVYISRSMLPAEVAGPVWNATLEHYTHYHVEHVMECVYELNAILKKQPESKYQATYKKYQNPKFLSVANIPAVNI